MLQTLCRKQNLWYQNVSDTRKAFSKNPPNIICQFLLDRNAMDAVVVEDKSENSELLNIYEISLSRDAAIVGKPFPGGDISIGIKEFPQDQNIRKECDDVFNGKFYLITSEKCRKTPLDTTYGQHFQ